MTDLRLALDLLPFAALTAAVAIAMEFWAMFLHGQVWHRWLWVTHASHHRTRQGLFEFNDVFAVLHAAIAIALIAWGEAGQGWAALTGPRWWALGIGAGMTAFGMAYFVVHDGLVHGRLPVQFLAKIRWLRVVRNAHRVHHRLESQDDGLPYGLFLGQWELRRARRLSREGLRPSSARLEHRSETRIQRTTSRRVAAAPACDPPSILEVSSDRCSVARDLGGF